LHQHGTEIQKFGTIRLFPIALSYDARLYACQRLNRILADSLFLHALYKKHHWLMRGATFYQLHLLLDKHSEEQAELIDSVAERIQTLGGVAVGDPRLVAEVTQIPRAPDGCEEVPAMLSRLLEAHEIILIDAHDAATKALRAAVGRHGLEDLQVYPPLDQSGAALARESSSIMGVRLQDATWRPADATPPPAVHASPEGEACRRAFVALIEAAARLAAVSGNLERLSYEYRRSVRRARALHDVLLPDLDRAVYGIEGRLEELEQEDAISMRRSAVT
jgi:starvation-inducible DNA-binding protein